MITPQNTSKLNAVTEKKRINSTRAPWWPEEELQQSTKQKAVERHSMALAVSVSVLMLLCVCVSVCFTDYYSVLGVSHSASEGEIKKAFHQLARKLHPDRNHSPDAQHVFTQLAQAYEVLSNRETRRIYDQNGKQDFPDDQHGSHGNSDFLAFRLHELLNMLWLEDDFTMFEDEGLTQGWSFTVWDEAQDDDGDHLGNMFGML
ncbi:chaperone protein dnaJ GFA2, mitochondrial isoform X2 [Tachysurus fulvidraco]|uniref:chaperone protein dnaJ GFA2, mitochondrial isoform X2 n=1 Tax=Tachysurus fulvidraco TaxID=1234273 RepID=UPI001FEF4B11|nr:chaperone protein dnaJ GFA2, mitochondrial isoform X2 [Tachysurus fulvidraco]